MTAITSSPAPIEKYEIWTDDGYLLASAPDVKVETSGLGIAKITLLDYTLGSAPATDKTATIDDELDDVVGVTNKLREKLLDLGWLPESAEQAAIVFMKHILELSNP